MHIQDAAFIGVDEIRCKQPHVTGQHHNLHPQVIQDRDNEFFMIFTRSEEFGRENGHRDAMVIGARDRIRLGIVANHDGDLSAQLFAPDRRQDHFKIRAVPGTENGDTLGQLITQRAVDLFLQIRLGHRTHDAADFLAASKDDHRGNIHDPEL